MTKKTTVELVQLADGSWALERESARGKVLTFQSEDIARQFANAQGWSIDESTVSFNLGPYADSMMGSIAFAELMCVFAGLDGAKPPTEPEAWRKLFHKHGHTNNPEAAYAHAVAAGFLVPSKDAMHAAERVVRHAQRVTLLKTAA